MNLLKPFYGLMLLFFLTLSCATQPKISEPPLEQRINSQKIASPMTLQNSGIRPVSVALKTSGGLDLLRDQDWKGECSASEINSDQSVRTVYTVKNQRLQWLVQSFSDKNCKKLFTVTRYILNCQPVKKSSHYNCLQSSEKAISQDGKEWEHLPIIDHIRYPVVLEYQILVEPLSPDKVRIISSRDSGKEVTTESLTR